MSLGDLCVDPSFLDAWGECFADLPLELLRTLAVLSRAWNARLFAHFLTCDVRVRLGRADCTQENATFLLGLVRRCTGRLMNRTLKIDFEGDEGGAAPGQWRGFDLYEWMRKHEVLRETRTKWHFADLIVWKVEPDTPLVAAFLLGRAAACEFNVGARRISVEMPFANNVIQNVDPTTGAREPPRKALPPARMMYACPENTQEGGLHKHEVPRMSEVALMALSGCFLVGALGLAKHHNASDITLAHRRVDDAGALEVLRAMRALNATPRALNLQSTVTKLSMGVFGALCGLVPRGATFCTKLLYTLDLSRNALGQTGIERLSRLFMSCRWRELPELRNLNLSRCDICDRALEDHLAPCFATEMVLGCLKILRLSGNHIKHAGLNALQSHATRMPELERLDLNECLFPIGAAEDFALWLKRDARWPRINAVEMLRVGGTKAMEEEWKKAQSLVDRSVNVHRAEREWKEALPPRLRFV